jgi:chromosomal replication initiator protein
MEWLRAKLDKRLLEAARQFLPDIRKPEYRIIQEVIIEPEEKPEPEIASGPRQITIGDLIRRSGPMFNPRFTFDKFVIGNCNQFAYATAMTMVTAQQSYNQSAYLLAETGLGKSHLSHSIGNFLVSQKPDTRVQYVTAEQFANEMISSLRNDRIELFKKKYRNDCDVLLLEKVEFLSGKEKIQNELVYTLDELMDRGKKILCTGNAFPRDIPRLNTELQSRLSGLMVAAIEPPDFNTRMEIIKRKAAAENLRLPTNVVEFLAERLTGDIRRLESCLVGMMAKTNILRIPISLGLARDVTQSMLDRLPKITVDQIQRNVSSTFQVSVDDLRSPSRKRDLAVARKVAMYICRKYTNESLVAIGKSFKRSHISVLYAVNGLTKDMEANAKLKRQVEYVIRRLETSCLTSQ